MNQQPRGSKNIDKRKNAQHSPPLYVNRPNNSLSVGSIHSPDYRLPPPPSYTSHLMRTIVQSEPKYLSNWCVNVKTIKLEQGDTTLIAALSGTLLKNDRKTISYKSYDAGKLVIIISKNTVQTNNGVYHLLGPIAQGFPNNLYRACLEAGGIPRTWKYTLTQYSGSGDNQRTTSTVANTDLNTIGMGVQNLARSYGVLRHLTVIADRRLKDHLRARKYISFVRHQFQQKLTQSLKFVNNEIIMGLKEILEYD